MIFPCVSLICGFFFLRGAISGYFFRLPPAFFFLFTVLVLRMVVGVICFWVQVRGVAEMQWNGCKRHLLLCLSTPRSCVRILIP